MPQNQAKHKIFALIWVAGPFLMSQRIDDISVVTIVGHTHPVFRTLFTKRSFVHTAIASAAVWYRIPIAALRRICTPFGAIEAHARCALVLEFIWQAPVGIVRDRKASV